MFARVVALCAALLLLTALSVGIAQDKPPTKESPAAVDDIDWPRAQQLRRRVQKGEKLNAEDEAYYQRALKLIQAGRGPGRAAREARDTIKELVPLTELGKDKYKGEVGGLYGEGSNDPPAKHFARAKEATAKIEPLNKEGKPDPSGKIVLLSIGMSNTAQEFTRFVQLANKDERKSPRVVVVNGAQGGQAAIEWNEKPATWQNAERLLAQAGVAPPQVQVVWLKQALIQQGKYGEFPKHKDRFADELVKIVLTAQEKYPNLRVIYLGSRIYAGQARGDLNPEPYAYEGAFAVRDVIQWQIAGEHKLDKAPVLLWGPYLWANGTSPRKDNELTYQPEDFVADGVHPSNTGRDKVAKLLLDFFTADELAKTWFATQ